MTTKQDDGRTECELPLAGGYKCGCKSGHDGPCAAKITLPEPVRPDAQAYRDLKPGELIQDKDEYLKGDKWIPADSGNVGKSMGVGSVGCFRRPVQTEGDAQADPRSATPVCAECRGTGIISDQGPGIARGCQEFVTCDCRLSAAALRTPLMDAEARIEALETEAQGLRRALELSMIAWDDLAESTDRETAFKAEVNSDAIKDALADGKGER